MHSIQSCRRCAVFCKAGRAQYSEFVSVQYGKCATYLFSDVPATAAPVAPDHPPTPVPLSPRPAQVYESVLTQMHFSQAPQQQPQTPIPAQYVDTQDKFQSITIMETESITLRCKSTGHQNPTITWTKDGKFLVPGQSPYKIEIGPDESTLLINSAVMDDAGWYQCTVTSPAGTTSIRGKVIVQPLPEPVTMSHIRAGDASTVRQVEER